MLKDLKTLLLIIHSLLPSFSPHLVFSSSHLLLFLSSLLPVFSFSRFPVLSNSNLNSLLPQITFQLLKADFIVMENTSSQSCIYMSLCKHL